MTPLFELLDHIETEVMRLGNRAIDRLVLYYLMNRMDAGTGMVGVKSAVSRGRMALDLSEKGGSGWRKRPLKFTQDDIKHCLERLVAEGVLNRSSSPKKLVVQFVFWSEKLTSHQSAKNEVARSTAGGRPVESINNHIVNDNKPQEVARQVAPNLTNTITTNTRDEFYMHNDWLPVQGFADQAFMAGFKVRKGEEHRGLLDEAIVDVRLYWQSSKGQHRRENQQGWHHELLRTMKRLQAQRMAMAAGNVTPIGAAKKKTKLLRVPWNMEAKPLEDWGVKVAGFRKAKAGEDRDDYRACLVTHVELLNNKRECAGNG